MASSRGYEDQIKAQGALVRAARRARGLSQEELTYRLRPAVVTTQASLSNYERGLREMPLNVARELAWVLEIPLAELAEADGVYLADSVAPEQA